MAMNDRSWDKLLDNVHNGEVVPIVGTRLLVGPDGKSSLLADVARRLLEDNGKPSDVPLTPFREVHEAVFQVRDTVHGLDLYEAVEDAFNGTIHPGGEGDTPFTPAPIQQLAQISDLRLYVTLTPDNLLFGSLSARSAVEEIVNSAKWPTNEWKDLPTTWRNNAGTVYLLYLFGKLRSGPMFTIHDEDVLEYAHNIIACGSQVPTTFLGELRRRNLLLIGCNFPEWVTRFFLRACSETRLSQSEHRSWLIEPLAPEDNLTVFLKSYASEAQILSQSPPVEFVDELHRRWMEKYGGAQTKPAPIRQRPLPKALFFISYSRCNIVQAQAIYEALRKAGASEGEIWFDKENIEPGQDFQRQILDGIGGCKYFLPLISLEAVGRDEGWVFKEWLRATERGEIMNRDFLLPVVVDAEYHPEQYRQKSVLNWNDNHIDFGFAPNGAPNDHLAERLKRLVDAERNLGGQS